MTMMLSPQSMCGVKVVLCLPRSRMAITLADLPSTPPSASTMYHLFWMSDGLAEKVFMTRSIRFQLFRRPGGADIGGLPGDAGKYWIGPVVSSLKAEIRA